MKARRLLLGAAFVVSTVVFAAANEEEEDVLDLEHQSEWDEDRENSYSGDLYLYHKGDAWPIIDFDGDYWPEWLYSDDNGPRVVEFYAPWCPFCQAFRDHYIQFARVMNELTKEMHGQQIKFYAVSCAANKPICRDFKVKGFPQLRLFREGSSKVAAKMKYYSLHPYEVLDVLGIKIDLELGKNQELIAQLQTQHKEKGDISFPPRTKQDLFDDAYLSFDFMLRNSVFMDTGAVEEDRQIALQLFLELLRGFIPPAWRLAKYIRAVLEHFEQAMKSEDTLLEIADKYKPEKQTWSYACTKGVAGMGYSCGLWQLFHIYSIGMIEWNSLLDENQERMVITTVQAADILRDFIEGFLDCEVCRQNFIKAYDTCAFNRCERLNDDFDMDQLMQLPLWLWETHNAVNQRLLREHGQQQGWNVTVRDQRLRRWPSREDCPTCWNRDGSWDEETVYKFLRVEYWLEDTITEEYRQDIFEDVDLEKVMKEEAEELARLEAEEKARRKESEEIAEEREEAKEEREEAHEERRREQEKDDDDEAILQPALHAANSNSQTEGVHGAGSTSDKVKAHPAETHSESHAANAKSHSQKVHSASKHGSGSTADEVKAQPAESQSESHGSDPKGNHSITITIDPLLLLPCFGIMSLAGVFIIWQKWRRDNKRHAD